MRKEGGINHFKREGHADMYSPQIVSFVARQPNHVTFDIQSVSQLQAVMKQFRFQYVIFSDLQIYILSHLLVSVQCSCCQFSLMSLKPPVCQKSVESLPD